MTASRQLPLELEHRPALAMDDFLVADCNLAAVRWIDRWPDWPGPVLVVTGPAGCGKTHLAHVWQERSDAALCAAAALDANVVAAAREARAAFVVEDADPPLPLSAEQALFHLCNVIAERRGHLLVTAKLPPVAASFALPDLASRLAAAAQASIGMPDDALLAAVLVKLFRDRQLSVPADVIDHLVRRIERSFAGAAQAVAAIDRAALAQKRPVNLALVREVVRQDPAS